MHEYVKLVYGLSSNFPKEEIYGSVSQIRRAALSVILNYVEGYARRRSEDCKVYKNFIEISYGSLKESKYLLFFSYDMGYIDEEVYKKGVVLAEKIGKMLWSLIK